MKILSTKFSYPSANLLRNAIENISGKRFLITTNPSNEEIIVRYGNGCKIKPAVDTQYNTAKFVNLLANKLSFSLFLDKNRFFTPQFLKDLEFLVFPCLIRTTLTGSKGKGIIYCKDEKTFKENWSLKYYWTKYENIFSEYRVHLLGGEPVKIFRKVWVLESEEPECRIRSNNNYHFSLVEQKEGRFTKLYELINRLNDVLGTNNFCALDIGYTEKDYFIIEGNSAPGLNELTAEIYAKFLIDKIDLLKGC